jgi:hypothetical protein
MCLGCFRSLEEIKEWQVVDNHRRRIILQNARRRLLRACFSGLSTLGLKRCCCVELLLDARLNSQPLFGLLGLRGSACPGRDGSLTEAASGERQTDHKRCKYSLHFVTPLTISSAIFDYQSRFWEGRSAQFGDRGNRRPRADLAAQAI